MDVAARARPDASWPFLAHERESLRAVRVVIPPDVVDFSIERLHPAKHARRLGRRASPAPADVPDLHSVVPQRDEQESVPNERVVDERISGHLGEDLARRSWRAEI